MAFFWIRFSRSLFLTKSSLFVLLSLTASLVLSVVVGSLSDGVGKRWFHAINLVAPPLFITTTLSQDPLEQSSSLIKDLPVPIVPFHREPVAFSSSHFFREALTINRGPHLNALTAEELLIPKSWTDMNIGDEVVLLSLQSGKTIKKKITGFFSDFPGLTDDLILTEWPASWHSFACFASVNQISSFKHILKKELPSTWHISTLEEHPVYGEWLRALSYDHMLISWLIGAILCIGLANIFLFTMLLLYQKRTEIALIQSMGGSFSTVLASFCLWLGGCFFVAIPLAFFLSFLVLEWGIKGNFWIKKLPIIQEIPLIDFLQDIHLVLPPPRQIPLFFLFASLGVLFPVLYFWKKCPEKLFRGER